MTNRHCVPAALLLIASSAGLWAADPAVGTWVLDTKKSVFLPGPAPLTQTRVYREGPDGVIATVVTVPVKGKPATVEYPVNYDGQAYAVEGSQDFDAIKVTKVTLYRSESTLLHAGRVMASATRVVSADEKTLTITYKSTTRDGKDIRNTQVYNRQ
ncbi:MAG: hypothetical protein ABI995_03710 [Acidobacteriota bacterium]